MKLFFLDTSVLMNLDDFHAQTPREPYAEYEEYVTYYTILELEGLKKSKDSSKAFAARKALHYIEDNDIDVLYPKKVRVFWSKYHLDFLPNTNDANIIRTFYDYYFSNEIKDFAVFYTYDLAQYMLMEAALVEAQNKINVNFRLNVIHYTTLADNEETLVPYRDDATEGKGWIESGSDEASCLQMNQYWIDSGTNEIKRIYWDNDEDGEDFAPINYKSIHSHFMGEVKPRNPQQEMLFDLLQNPDIKVKLALGKFGSGKSFVMLAHAIDLVQRGKFDKLIFIRNTISVKDTKDIGALPGGLYEKLWPYLMAVADHVGGEDGLMQLIDDHIIEPVHLGYLRGRDFKRCIIFCDECEHLTKQHVQLILGRAAEGSEVWFAGDLKQRDSKVFETNSGIVEMLKKLTGNPLFGTVTLIKSERSEVAQLADELD